MAQTFTKQNFQDEVINNKGKVLVDFWASWCGPCQMMAPIIDEVSKEVTNIKIGKVNVDEEQDLASQYGIMSIPTLMLFQDGKIIKQQSGAIPKEKLLEFIK